MAEAEAGKPVSRYFDIQLKKNGGSNRVLVSEVVRILDFKYLCELETKGCADGWDVEFE